MLCLPDCCTWAYKLVVHVLQVSALALVPMQVWQQLAVAKLYRVQAWLGCGKASSKLQCIQHAILCWMD